MVPAMGPEDSVLKIVAVFPQDGRIEISCGRFRCLMRTLMHIRSTSEMLIEGRRRKPSLIWLGERGWASLCALLSIPPLLSIPTNEPPYAKGPNTKIVGFRSKKTIQCMAVGT